MIDIHTQDACKMDRRAVRILAEARQRELNGELFDTVLRDTIYALKELNDSKS